MRFDAYHYVQLFILRFARKKPNINYFIGFEKLCRMYNFQEACNCASEMEYSDAHSRAGLEFRQFPIATVARCEARAVRCGGLASLSNRQTRSARPLLPHTYSHFTRVVTS